MEERVHFSSSSRDNHGSSPPAKTTATTATATNAPPKPPKPPKAKLAAAHNKMI